MSALPVRRSTGRPITKRDRERFLSALEDGSTVRDACRLIGRPHRTLYELRKTDDEFAQTWDEAWEIGTQALETEAHRRAVDGYIETTYGKDGEVLRSVHRYSDALLQKLLAGRRPDVYGNNSQTVAVAVSQGLDQDAIDASLERFTAQFRNRRALTVDREQRALPPAPEDAAS